MGEADRRREAEWLVYKQVGDTLEIDIRIWKLLEIIPDDIDTWCLDVYPVIDEIQSYGLRQIVRTDIKGIKAHRLKPMTLLKLILNIYEYTKDDIRLSRFQAQGVDPFVQTLVESVKCLLPACLRKMIVLES